MIMIMQRLLQRRGSMNLLGPGRSKGVSNHSASGSSPNQALSLARMAGSGPVPGANGDQAGGLSCSGARLGCSGSDLGRTPAPTDPPTQSSGETRPMDFMGRFDSVDRQETDTGRPWTGRAPAHRSGGAAHSTVRWIPGSQTLQGWSCIYHTSTPCAHDPVGTYS